MLKEKVISSVKWNTIATIYSIVVQVLRLVILTRLLEKSDFGIVAIAVMVISFTEIFSDLGITVALIHKQDITESQYSSVFWLNIFSSIFLYIVVCVLTPVIADVYSEDVLLYIIPLLSVQILLSAVGKMFQTIKTKELEFRFLSIVKIVSHTFGLLLTIVLAVAGCGVFSIVWGQLLQVAINQTCYLVAGRKDHAISLHFDIKEIQDILRIGAFQLGARIMDVLASKVDVLLIGKFFGMEDLGVYNLAKELILRPLQIIQQLVNNVASAAFAKIQTNYQAVQQHFSFLLKSVASLSFPIYMCAFIFAEPIIEVMYSSKFIDAAFFLRVLSLYGMFNSLMSISSTLLTSYGKTNIAFYMTIVSAILSILVVVIASNFTIKSVAYGQAFVAFVSYFIYWKFAVNTTTKMGLLKFINAISTPLLVTLLTSLPFLFLFILLNIPTLFKLILIIAFAAFYSLIYYIVAPAFSKDIMRAILKKK